MVFFTGGKYRMANTYLEFICRHLENESLCQTEHPTVMLVM